MPVVHDDTQPLRRGRVGDCVFALGLCTLLCLACEDTGPSDAGLDPCLSCSPTETCRAGTCVPASDDCCVDLGREDTGTPVDVGPDDSGLVDLGVERDLGPPDMGPVDPCAPAGSFCVEARDCRTERPSPTNCDFCPADHRSLCFGGRCQTPRVLEIGDVQEVTFAVEGAFVSDLTALVGVVVARETSGGVELSCDDVVQPGFDLGNACYNALTSRLIAISQGGQIYTFTFGTFSAEVPVLLLVYGFDDRRASNAPLGVSCTPHEAGAPGSGRVRLPGNPMRSL